MRQPHPDDESGWRAPGCDPTASPVVTDTLERLDRTLSDLNELSLAALAPTDVTRLLDAVTTATGRLTCATSRVVREADRRRIAEDEGARNTPTWWAHRSRLTRGEAGRVLGLAKRLDTDLHAPVADALASGRLHTDQAGVVVHAVDALPEPVPLALRVEARDRLLGYADELHAHALLILGKRILDVVAPDIAESEEQKRLEDEDAKANAKARITFFDDGHGQCHGRFTLPSHIAALLRHQLHAIANPRRHPLGDAAGQHQQKDAEGMPEPVITPERLGQAFVTYIESYPADGLPSHGGGAFDLTVILGLDTLLTGVGAATLSTGGRISAGEARRLACQAGLVPVVLDGDSRPLDLGRSKRLSSPAQRRAMEVRDHGCTTEGCGMPASTCDAHHDEPWSQGGATDLDKGRLLCPRHHRLAHDRRYTLRQLPDRRVSFHRRT